MTMDNSTVLNSTRSSPCPGLFRSPTTAEKWSQVIGLLTIILFSFVGNAIIIIIIKQNRRMRTPTNLFIINLCFANLLITLLNTPLDVIGRIAPEIGFVSGLAGTILCKVLNFSQACTINAAILTLTVIAADRFIAIFFPLKRVINSRMAKWLIAVVWLAPALSGSILLFVSQLFEFHGRWFCVEMWEDLFPYQKNANKVYTTVDFVAFYTLPLMEITACYAAIIYKIWMRQIPGELTSVNRRLELQAKRNVLKMLITAVAVFALCWVPSKVMFMVMTFGEMPCFPSNELYFTSLFLAFSNCATNPFVVLTFSRDFKLGFKGMLQDLSACCRIKLKVRLPNHHTRSVDVMQTTQIERGNALSLKTFKKIEDI